MEKNIVSAIFKNKFKVEQDPQPLKSTTVPLGPTPIDPFWGCYPCSYFYKPVFCVRTLSVSQSTPYISGH